MIKPLCFLILFALAVTPAFADDRSGLVGVWKVVSYDFEFKDAGESRPALGSKPNGYLIFTPEGRMIAYIEASLRQAPKTDKERSEAYRAMLAYSGRYRLEGDAWITRVDASWNPLWLGTDQKRFFKLTGDRLDVTSPWNASSSGGGRIMRGHLVFEREK